LKPHLEGYEYLYQNVPESLTADAGYGSQENFELLNNKGIQAYVKFNTFDKEQNATGKKTKNIPFHRDTLHYNEQEDHYVCPMGQRMEKISENTKTTKSGYKQTYTKYRAKNCMGCPIRGACFTAVGNRVVQRNHTLEHYKQKAREALLSEIGQLKRKKRTADVEPVFAHIKHNRNFKRFTHRGLEKVELEFGLHALAHNIRKKCA
jgi:hypothetical protein